MLLYMLSTEIASCLIRGQSQALDEHVASSAPEELCISAITRGELLCGVSQQMLQETDNNPELEELSRPEAQQVEARIVLKRFKTHSDRIVAAGRGKAMGTLLTSPTRMDSLRRATHAALAHLTPREAAALRRRFGIDTDSGHTLEKVAKQLEATRDLIRGKARTQNVSRVVEQLLARVPCRAWDAAAATHFARVAVGLHQTGRPMSTTETMIAGHAIAIGAVLVTTDEHRLSRVADLKTENWTRRNQRR
ncbi:MAG: hypothetical protein ACREUT_13170 [Steroidobacteraceae bacterium]